MKVARGMVILTCFLLAGANSFCESKTFGDEVDYGHFDGETVTFNSVSEISVTDEAGVFGAPLQMGDTVSFTPFGLQGLANGGVDFAEGRLSMVINAKPGHVITSIDFFESASVFLFNESMVSASSIGSATTEDGIMTAESIMTLSGNSLVSTASFSSGFTIDFSGEQQIGFVLDSSVFSAAFSDSALASLSKDSMLLRVNTASVPEPSGIALLLTLFAVRAMGRRR